MQIVITQHALQHPPVICPLAWRGGCQLRLIQAGLPSTATAVKSRGAVVGTESKHGSLCRTTRVCFTKDENPSLKYPIVKFKEYCGIAGHYFCDTLVKMFQWHVSFHCTRFGSKIYLIEQNRVYGCSVVLICPVCCRLPMPLATFCTLPPSILIPVLYPNSVTTAFKASHKSNICTIVVTLESFFTLCFLTKRHLWFNFFTQNVWYHLSSICYGLPKLRPGNRSCDGNIKYYKFRTNSL